MTGVSAGMPFSPAWQGLRRAIAHGFAGGLGKVSGKGPGKAARDADSDPIGHLAAQAHRDGAESGHLRDVHCASEMAATSATPSAVAARGDRASTTAAPLLDIRNLATSFITNDGVLPVTRNISFSLEAGERVGLVGESGCGKSVTGLSLMRLLPPQMARIHGEIRLDGEDLMTLSPRRMRAIRGRDIAMIFQEPMSALDPVFTVGEQISEAWRVHFPERRNEARARAMAALENVGIPAPERRFDEYPHQLSGGMRQRVMIAMALICEPRLIIADEPTTALDVTIQAQITDLLRDLCERTGAALIFITHDLGVVAETCTRMITMYAGEIVEDAPVDDVLTRPRHPYTSGLLRSLPSLSARRGVLPSIPGRVPSPARMPAGCRFRERCAEASAGCEREQALLPLGGDHVARCWRAPELDLPGSVTPDALAALAAGQMAAPQGAAS